MIIGCISLINLISTVIIFLVGYYVFLKDPKKRPNLVFFLFSLAATLWQLGNFLLVKVFFPNYLEIREQILRSSEGWLMLTIEDISWLGTAFLAPLYLHLSLLVSKQKDILNRKIVQFFIYFFPSFIFISMLIYDFCFDL